jgi:hypothetical protein
MTIYLYCVVRERGLKKFPRALWLIHPFAAMLALLGVTESGMRLGALSTCHSCLSFLIA